MTLAYADVLALADPDSPPPLPPHIDRVERVLVAAKWPAISPWWRKRIARAYATGAFELIFRVGRRGGKSSTMCRIAVAEALYGDHYVAPGDVGVYAIISAERPQAVERLSTVKAILAVLGIECKPLSERVEFMHINRAIRCYTASLSGVVSMTCIGAMLDEMTRWEDSDSGANPAKEIISSLMPTMATCPNAKVWMISSPWSTLDEHHRRFELGDGDGRMIFHGATWEANPTLSEERTHELEPDEQAWNREYAAIPMASDESKFFSAALIDAARKVRVEGRAQCNAAGADFAFSKDSSGLVTGALVGDVAAVTSDTQWKVTGVPLRPTAVVSEAISLAEAAGAEGLACDTHYLELVREETEAVGLDLISFPSTAEGIAQAYTDVRVMLGRGQISLAAASATLCDELKDTIGKPTQHSITIIHPRKNGSHGDLARAFVTMVWALKNGVVGNAVTGGARRGVSMGVSRGGGGEQRGGGMREYADED